MEWGNPGWRMIRCGMAAILLSGIAAGADWQSLGPPANPNDGPLSIQDSRFYQATNQGVNLSLDHGATWAFIRNSPTFISNWQFTGERVFAATRPPGLVDKPGMWRSDDGGSTWRLLSPGKAPQDSLALSYPHCFASIGPYLIAGSGYGIFRSEDNGENWNRVDTSASFQYGPNGATVYSLAVQGNILLAASSNGLYRSSDSGAFGSWKYLGTGPGSQLAYNLYVQGRMTYALTNQYVLFRSENAGSDWDPTGSSYCFAFATGGSKVYFEDYSGFHRSDDSGISWSKVNGNDAFRSLAAQGDTVLAQDPARGTYLSIDGGIHFRLVSPSILDASSMAGDGTRILLGNPLYLGGLYGSMDRGESWSVFLPESPDSGGFPAVSVEGENFFAASRKGAVFLSPDAGKTWKTASGIPDTGGIETVAIAHGILFAGTGSGLYKSGDGGSHWARTHSAAAPRPYRLRGTSLLVHGEDIFLGDDDGLFRSSDTGSHWTKADGDFLGPVNALATGGNTLFAAASNGVFRSADGRGAWSNVSPDSGDVRILAANGQEVIAMNMYGHAFRSFDEGAGWTEIQVVRGLSGSSENESLPLAIWGSDLYAAGGSVSRIPLDDITAVGIRAKPKAKSGGKEPGPRVLSGASGPTLVFTIRQKGQVRIELRDILGRSTVVLKNSVMEAGEHLLPLGQGLRAGIYVLDFRAGGIRTSCKLAIPD